MLAAIHRHPLETPANGMSLDPDCPRSCLMKLLIRSAMIFFGTLVAAAVLVLGEPAQADVAVAVSGVAPR